jgi:homoserine dehydrogenase
MIKVGIIGLGTVGSSVVNILNDNKEIIESRAGKTIKVVKGVVRDISKVRNLDIPISNNIDDIINDDNIDIVIELTGGVDLPYKIVKNSLLNNKSVITANKAMLAYHREELENISKNLSFGYEASVAGGIPIISSLRDGLSANNIIKITGIMNGTCNYILTKMHNEYISYKDVLKEAMDLGYAEANPTLDVGGFDAAHKILILASIAYDLHIKPEDILIEGIENITQEDISFAKDFDYKIKLLTIAKIDNKKVEIRVHPTFIKNTTMLSKVDGVMNAISVIGDKVGETLFYGAGAGGDATASAVIANLIDIVKNNNSSAMLGFQKKLSSQYSLKNIEDNESKYYLRLHVDNKPGILSKISSIFGENNISIESVSQKINKEEIALLLLSTKKTTEKNIRKTINEIEKLDIVYGKNIIIRIEE